MEVAVAVQAVMAVTLLEMGRLAEPPAFTVQVAVAVAVVAQRQALA